MFLRNRDLVFLIRDTEIFRSNINSNVRFAPLNGRTHTIVVTAEGIVTLIALTAKS